MKDVFEFKDGVWVGDGRSYAQVAPPDIPEHLLQLLTMFPLATGLGVVHGHRGMTLLHAPTGDFLYAEVQSAEVSSVYYSAVNKCLQEGKPELTTCYTRLRCGPFEWSLDELEDKLGENFYRRYV
jgi:hypothetical protein